MRQIQADEWDSVSSTNGSVLIDFYADWCGPCKALAPVLSDLEKQYEDQIEFYKVNIDEASELTARLGISSVPTLYMIKSGEVVSEITGAIPKLKLNREIVDHLL